ncbi:MAG: FmdE family protein [Desulfatiglandaceae bacterium]
MTQPTISPERIRETIAFHGHNCPGVSIGIRVSELVLRDFERAPDDEVVAVVETDNCAVDAIQYLTGCTLGKGNLIHLDHGKNVFTFYRRSDEKGMRICLRSDTQSTADSDIPALYRKHYREGLTPEEEERLATARQAMIERIMTAGLKELFDVQPAEGSIPRKARIMEGIPCDQCGERTMETRTRRFMGRTLCIPCYESLEKST